ncbi:MAG: saccharopine dehydrogenase NADP-binding domain-containing protein [Acidobacteriota bacterium]|nr:MAG: saccharopine dehydrogenase NADP-binding domain-containing protein [Acidobacteriota bacterium]
MKKVLVLGAGLVSRPLVRYLLGRAEISVTVASRTESKAQALIAGHSRGAAQRLLADDTSSLDELIKAHDLTVSLLPAPLHPVVAEMCIRHGRHMVTTSYVSPKMNALDGPAKQKEVMILNEIGVDPGIDHMSAMRIIDDVGRRGGEVISFRSYCGGLPAPEANDNPWGYKFSWSPRAVCTAGKNAARYREDGKLVDIAGPELFTHVETMHVETVGDLEAYPNRDSLIYIDVYGLGQIETMFRGTFRYPGWCQCLKKVVDLGLLEESPVTYPTGTTFARWMAEIIGAPSPDNLRDRVAEKTGLTPSHDVLERLEWLGLFSSEPLPIIGEKTTRLDILAARMGEKMPYQRGERDMIVLLHKFIARFPNGRQENISSTLIDYGQPEDDSAMARTVSLPAAVGARMILSGEITASGVHVPVTPEIYNPVLDELESMGIRCVEKTEETTD